MVKNSFSFVGTLQRLKSNSSGELTGSSAKNVHYLKKCVKCSSQTTAVRLQSRVLGEHGSATWLCALPSLHFPGAFSWLCVVFLLPLCIPHWSSLLISGETLIYLCNRILDHTDPVLLHRLPEGQNVWNQTGLSASLRSPTYHQAFVFRKVT